MNILFIYEVDWLAKVVFYIHFLPRRYHSGGIGSMLLIMRMPGTDTAFSTEGLRVC